MTRTKHESVINPSLMSDEMLSNIFTKSAARKAGALTQHVGEPYSIPSSDVLKLCATLILEEALETIAKMGFAINVKVTEHEGNSNKVIGTKDHCVDPDVQHFSIAHQCETPNLEGMIDDALDLKYVASGLLVSCGVPDLLHMMKVCRANDAKFPNGEATLDPGNHNKYLKPPGWKHPVHLDTHVCLGHDADGRRYTMKDIGENMLETVK